MKTFYLKTKQGKNQYDASIKYTGFCIYITAGSKVSTNPLNFELDSKIHRHLFRKKFLIEEMVINADGIVIEDISCDSISEACIIILGTDRHASTAFKDENGMTIKEYINSKGDLDKFETKLFNRMKPRPRKKE